MIPRIFDGESVFIVASGPSLIGFDFDRLRGKNVIAINREYEFLPEASVLWWSDKQFWLRHGSGIARHAARYKATHSLQFGPGELPSWVHVYRSTGLQNFDPSPGNIRHGNNSTYCCMHLAAHLGAKRIVLLGVDMRFGTNGQTHHHGGHGVVLLEETMREVMIPYFADLKPWLDALQISVLNASIDSALAIWPRCNINEGIAWGSKNIPPSSPKKTR